MASNTHVDSRVAERRLRPIYDWLDSGNNKKALQEAEKVLKKQPSFLCAKVLKALALQRLGREAECEEILEKVIGEVPTDEATLQAITICYRAIHKPDKICQVYSAASKKDPTNEELLTHLFMSYVRVGDYKKQHQHAMSLYKLRPKNPYYFWAVMSVVMQAKGDEKMGQTFALKLAEKMVSKFVTEGKIEAEQEVQLYLMILEMQGKYEEALDVIEGELGEKLKSLVTTSGKRIELLMKLERWKEANVLLKCHLEKNPDSWSDYSNYLETMTKLNKEFKMFKETNNSENSKFDNRVPVPSDGGECIVWYEADFTPQMANSYIQEIIKKAQNENKKFRGPYLAQLELYRMLEVQSLDAQNIIGDITNLLVDYFDKFGEKSICLSDLRPYLHLLNSDSASLFMKRINDIVGLEDGEPATSLSSLQKHISRLKFSRSLGFHGMLSVEERLKLCSKLLENYKSSHEFVSPNKLPTDFLCNDSYIILVSHILYSIYRDTNCISHIVTAIHHLENALILSPSNFHFKLLLVKFYLLLGAAQPAFHFYEQLEVKHVQLDSLGYLVATSLYGLGDFSAAISFYDASLKFFISNTNDSVDHLTYAYKYGSFMKIEEFIQFRDRLNDSLHYSFCTVEKSLHDILSTSDHSQSESVIKSMEIKSGVDKINWFNVRDNRDLNIIVSYEPLSEQLNDSTILKTFENLKNYVRLRMLTIRCLSSALDFVNQDSKDKQSNANDCIQNGDDSSCLKTALVNLVTELKCLYQDLNSQDLNLGIQNVINAPPPCRLKTYLTIPINRIIGDLVSIIIEVEEINLPEVVNKMDVQRLTESILETLSSTTNKCIIEINKESEERRQLLEMSVGVSEMLAIASVLVGNLKSFIKRSKKNTRKGKRKKEEEGGIEFQICRNILKVISECINDLDQALSGISKSDPLQNISSEVKALKIENESSERMDLLNINTKLKSSFEASIQEIRQYLQNKQSYVNALKC